MKIFILLMIFSLSAWAQEEESEALRALRLSCQQNVGLGCYNYANMLLKRDQQENANKYFEMGCKLEHADSCSKKTWDGSATASVSAESTPVATAETTTTETSSESTITETATVEEEPSTPAPASVEEPAATSEEVQTVEESPVESPSPEETELDLSVIE